MDKGDEGEVSCSTILNPQQLTRCQLRIDMEKDPQYENDESDIEQDSYETSQNTIKTNGASGCSINLLDASLNGKPYCYLNYLATTLDPKKQTPKDVLKKLMKDFSENRRFETQYIIICSSK